LIKAIKRRGKKERGRGKKRRGEKARTFPAAIKKTRKGGKV